MRFGSKSAGYKIIFKLDIVQRFGPGEEQVLQPLWMAEFSPIGLRTAEAEQIKKWAINRGMPLGEDHVTQLDPTFRFGVFDTVEFQQQHAGDVFPRVPNGFTDDHRIEMEQFLLDHQDEYYRVLESIKLPAPWPNYDKFRGVRGLPTGQRIAERVQEDGHDILAVLAYERENANRQEVIDALEALTASPVTDDEPLVAA